MSCEAVPNSNHCTRVGTACDKGVWPFEAATRDGRSAQIADIPRGLRGSVRWAERIFIETGSNRRVLVWKAAALGRRDRRTDLRYTAAFLCYLSRRRGNERDPETRSDPSCGCRWLQPARRHRRGQDTRTPQRAPQRCHRPGNSRSSRTHR